jgi:hypothetical protein
MKLLTENSSLKCQHKGVVRNKPSQNWVTIEKHSVLVDNDPEGRDIDRCPNRITQAGVNPCRKTLKVNLGYSTFIRIDGHAVCLDSLTGLTDGTPPGSFKYNVVDTRQEFVAGVA